MFEEQIAKLNTAKNQIKDLELQGYLQTAITQLKTLDKTLADIETQGYDPESKTAAIVAEISDCLSGLEAQRDAISSSNNQTNKAERINCYAVYMKVIYDLQQKLEAPQPPTLASTFNIVQAISFAYMQAGMQLAYPTLPKSNQDTATPTKKTTAVNPPQNTSTSKATPLPTKSNASTYSNASNYYSDGSSDEEKPVVNAATRKPDATGRTTATDIKHITRLQVTEKETNQLEQKHQAHLDSSIKWTPQLQAKFIANINSLLNNPKNELILANSFTFDDKGGAVRLTVADATNVYNKLIKTLNDKKISTADEIDEHVYQAYDNIDITFATIKNIANYNPSPSSAASTPDITPPQKSSSTPPQNSSSVTTSTATAMQKLTTNPPTASKIPPSATIIEPYWTESKKASFREKLDNLLDKPDDKASLIQNIQFVDKDTVIITIENAKTNSGKSKAEVVVNKLVAKFSAINKNLNEAIVVEGNNIMLLQASIEEIKKLSIEQIAAVKKPQPSATPVPTPFYAKNAPSPAYNQFSGLSMGSIAQWAQLGAAYLNNYTQDFPCDEKTYAAKVNNELFKPVKLIIGATYVNDVVYLQVTTENAAKVRDQILNRINQNGNTTDAALNASIAKVNHEENGCTALALHGPARVALEQVLFPQATNSHSSYQPPRLW